MPGGRGGRRPGAGRPPGPKTVRSRAVAARVIASGEAPLDILLKWAKHYDQLAVAKPDGTVRKTPHQKYVELACGFAKDAAPYIHARLSTAQIEGVKGGTPIPFAGEVKASVRVYLPDNGRKAGREAHA